jgi:hypothetical protein
LIEQSFNLCSEEPHHVLCGPHRVLGSATYNPRRHDVARSQIFQLAPVGPREDPHKVPFRDNAYHAIAFLADRHRANAMRVHKFCHRRQAVIGQACHKLLT